MRLAGIAGAEYQNVAAKRLKHRAVGEVAGAARLVPGQAQPAAALPRSEDDRALRRGVERGKRIEHLDGDLPAGIVGLDLTGYAPYLGENLFVVLTGKGAQVEFGHRV